MKRGEIYWFDLPSLGGREQAGLRPCIVVQDAHYARTSPMVLIVPLTTAQKTLRFAATLAAAPSKANGLTANSVALIFQIGAVDQRRVLEKIGVLEPILLEKTFVLLDQLTGRTRP